MLQWRGLNIFLWLPGEGERRERDSQVGMSKMQVLVVGVGSGITLAHTLQLATIIAELLWPVCVVNLYCMQLSEATPLIYLEKLVQILGMSVEC